MSPTLVYVCFCHLCFWRQVQKVFAETDVQELSPYVFQDFDGFGSYVQSPDPFRVVVCVAVKAWPGFILLHVAVRLPHALQRMFLPCCMSSAPLLQIT